ncbi:hypothetical protein [uncultured Pseudoteredinibacter sp.]|uniref:hypothetical protein n=1 Tax=uncultured Pseudoteredinibacter sp. TaxID=1641701 RepID=UPI002613EC18|nr:hypothetical protein [uncultured Pseudoteredinibacter sp.]
MSGRQYRAGAMDGARAGICLDDSIERAPWTAQERAYVWTTVSSGRHGRRKSGHMSG